jgi:hypothetical protein
MKQKDPRSDFWNPHASMAGEDVKVMTIQRLWCVQLVDELEDD